MKLYRLFVVVACLGLASGCQGPSKQTEQLTSQVKQLQDQVTLLQTEKQALGNKVKASEQMTSQVKPLQDQVTLLQKERQALEGKAKTAEQMTSQVKQLQDQVTLLQKEKQTSDTKVQTASTQPTGTGQTVSFTTDEEKRGYAIGFQAGSSFRAQELQLNLDMLTHGLKDGMGGQTSALPKDQTSEVMTALQKEMQAKMEKRRQEQAAQRKEQAEKNLAEGKVFLEANAKKEGVKVLASGLQYKVLKEGTGKTPVATDRVKVHYRGTLTNGTEFDSSYKGGKPTEFPVTQVIKGWVEALQLMKEGSKWELCIPPALAYGEPGRPNIPPNSVLVFEVELLEIVKPDPNAPPAPAPKPVPISVKPTPAPGAKPQ